LRFLARLVLWLLDQETVSADCDVSARIWRKWLQKRLSDFGLWNRENKLGADCYNCIFLLVANFARIFAVQIRRTQRLLAVFKGLT
jgi:hypothetical protein